jgi:hypothetical protein
MNRGKLRDDEQLDRQTSVVALSLFPACLKAAYGGHANPNQGHRFAIMNRNAALQSATQSKPNWRIHAVERIAHFG